VFSSEPISDPHICVARKADGRRCVNSVFVVGEEYCGVHRKQKKINRIDQPFTIRRRVKKVAEVAKASGDKASGDKASGDKASGDKASEALQDKADNEYSKDIKNSCAEILQASIWRTVVQKANRMRGLGFYNRNACNNRQDMFLFDSIEDIHPVDFYSVTDASGFTYGFHIETMYQYISKTIGITSPTVTSGFKPELFLNPYTKTPFGRKVFNEFKNLYCLYRILTKDRSFLQDAPSILSPEQHMSHTLTRVFQKMDELNNYTNTEWFLQMNRAKLIKFIYGVRELFEYRMDLPFARRLQVVSTGRVFALPVSRYTAMNDTDLRLCILAECEKLVSEGRTKDDRYLGSLVILTALTELVPKCAEAYPWLLQATF